MAEGLLRRFDRNPSLLLALLAAYALVQVAVRMLLPHGLRVDESQQVFLAQWLAVGYDAQPPLYNWLQIGVFRLVGDPVLGLALLKNAMLLAIYASYFALARLVTVNARLAAIATFGLFLTPQMFWQAQRDLTHTTGTLLLTNLVFLSAIMVLRRGSLGAYVLLGLSVGFGMLTKYNFVLTLPALAVAVWMTPGGRARLLDPRLLAAVIVAALICLPHGLWILSNLKAASATSMARMAEAAGDHGRLAQILIGLGNLAGTGLAIVAPSLVMLALIFGKPLLKAWRASDVWTRFFGLFLLVVLIELVGLVFATTFTSARDRWLLPFLYVLPIYGVAKAKAGGLDDQRALRRLLPFGLAIMAILPVAVLLSGSLSKDGHYREPYGDFAKLLAERRIDPALVVAPNWHIAGNLKAELPQLPVVSSNSPQLSLPHAASHEHPVLLVWRGKSADLPADFGTWLGEHKADLPNTAPAETVSLPFVGGDEPAEPFHYLLAMPR